VIVLTAVGISHLTCLMQRFSNKTPHSTRTYTSFNGSLNAHFRSLPQTMYMHTCVLLHEIVLPCCRWEQDRSSYSREKVKPPWSLTRIVLCDCSGSKFEFRIDPSIFFMFYYFSPTLNYIPVKFYEVFLSHWLFPYDGINSTFYLGHEKYLILMTVKLSQ
jgi:hypothetical protein